LKKTVKPLIADCSPLAVGFLALIVGQFISVTRATVNEEQSAINGEPQYLPNNPATDSA